MASDLHDSDHDRASWDGDLLARFPRRTLVILAEALVRSLKRSSKDNLIAVLRSADWSDEELLSRVPLSDLQKVCSKAGIDGTSVGRQSLAQDLIQHHTKELGLSQFDGDVPEIDAEQHPELRDWAVEYCLRAEAAGENIDFDQDFGGSVEATVRAIASIYEFCEWREFLSWQRYGFKPRADHWVVLTCTQFPQEWDGARILLKNPYDFPFSRMLMATSGGGNIDFTMSWGNGRPCNRSCLKIWANAVYDGVLYDFDEHESLVAVSGNKRGLFVSIGGYGSEVTDADGKTHTQGLCWL